MKKILSLLWIIFILTSCWVKEEDALVVDTTKTKVENLPPENLQPERKLDLYGKITWIEWNEITLLQVDTAKDPTFNMTATEKKKYMQSLEESARMALKEEINKATLWEVKLTVPVWIPIIKKTASWPEAPNIEGSIADFKVWQYISIWLNSEIKDQKIAEFVKIAFTQ